MPRQAQPERWKEDLLKALHTLRVVEASRRRRKPRPPWAEVRVSDARYPPDDPFSDPNELFDVYRSDGTPTGVVKRRADVHRDGDCTASSTAGSTCPHPPAPGLRVTPPLGGREEESFIGPPPPSCDSAAPGACRRTPGRDASMPPSEATIAPGRPPAEVSGRWRRRSAGGPAGRPAPPGHRVAVSEPTV